MGSNPRIKRVLGYVDHALFTLAVGVASFGVTYLRDLSKSMSALNEKLAMIAERTEQYGRHLSDHDARLQYLERKVAKE